MIRGVHYPGVYTNKEPRRSSGNTRGLEQWPVEPLEAVIEDLAIQASWKWPSRAYLPCHKCKIVLKASLSPIQHEKNASTMTTYYCDDDDDDDCCDCCCCCCCCCYYCYFFLLLLLLLLLFLLLLLLLLLPLLLRKRLHY